MSALPTNPIDLVEIVNVANWANLPAAILGNPNYNEVLANNIQLAITGFSDFVLWRTGRNVSYFTGVAGAKTIFSEVRDGNNSDSMGVLNGPVDASDPTKVSVIINNQVIPQSTAWNVYGWFVEQNASFIGLRAGQGFVSFAGFPFSGVRNMYVNGKGNVLLSYPGGYNVVPPSLFEAAMRGVNVIIQKALREDEGGRTTPQTGAVTSYRDYPWSKDIYLAVKHFERTMLSFGN